VVNVARGYLVCRARELPNVLFAEVSEQVGPPKSQGDLEINLSKSQDSSEICSEISEINLREILRLA
jgi:hypothetical protein